jgi:biopolymer transport protein ExbB/TolQ
MAQTTIDGSVYLSDILHLVAQAMLIPVMVILAALVVYAVFSVGSLAVEFITERRHFRVVIADFIDSINDATAESLPDVIERSRLLTDQKLVLVTVAKSIGLPKEDLFALAKAELANERALYDKVTARNSLATRAAPAFGLLGTLIPLGPGIVAMGKGNVELLASSLLIAFDTTAVGLLVSMAFLLISNFRKRWYALYMLALETGTRCLLQKAETASDTELGAMGYNAALAQKRMKRAQNRVLGAKSRSRPGGGGAGGAGAEGGVARGGAAAAGAAAGDFEH